MQSKNYDQLTGLSHDAQLQVIRLRLAEALNLPPHNNFMNEIMLLEAKKKKEPQIYGPSELLPIKPNKLRERLEAKTIQSEEDINKQWRALADMY